MVHLVKPSTGQAVDVPDSDRLLLGYYRGEGFVEQQEPAVQVVQLPDPDDEPAAGAGDATAAGDNGDGAAAGTDLTV